MLVFLFWFLIILILIPSIILFLLEIKIQINELKIKYEDIENKEIKLDIQLKGYILKKIRIFNVSIDNKKINKYFKKIDISKIYEKLLNAKKDDLKVSEIIKVFWEVQEEAYKKKSIKIEKTNLNIELGVLNIPITTAIVTTLGTVLAIPIVFLKEDYKYKISANYKDNKIVHVNLDFKSIITINLKHIINRILKIKKRGVDNNGRTSNTRFNEHCYE